MNSIEQAILSNLIYNEQYVRRVSPFLNEELFHDKNERVLYKAVQSFISKYNTPPTKEAVIISLDKNKSINEDEYKTIVSILEELSVDESTNFDWLINETEKFCKDKAVYNAIMESIHIIDGKSKDKSDTAIPEILSEALAVSFDTHIGHDYIEDAEERYDFYHKKESHKLKHNPKRLAKLLLIFQVRQYQVR